MEYDFQQVDVFTSGKFKGNPVAVVASADHLSTEEMQSFARWMNLSETTFLLKPTSPDADYRLRIFTPRAELPFAGHPTLGSCHAWLQAGGRPKKSIIIQECQAGLVPIRHENDRLAFAAPPLIRSGDLDKNLLEKIAAGLRIPLSSIQASAWVDNGPGWAGIMLKSREEVLALEPDYASMPDLRFGVIGAWDSEKDGTDAEFEVRAFAMGLGVNEDPVCGSLNASMAQWLIGSGLAPKSYIVSQGSLLGRDGRIYVDQIGDNIWIGGATTSNIVGKLRL
ncbi:PhzF family phenazine biosynthesis protein [Zymomonas mobilis]|uniref:PhzF family phenazine biosynthesis protein n=1 Tax=Zymomonas mobilis TaxID=542 RepID=UPI0003C74A51|nr:PhzF family phenazine biosynthesis protein [Zymomonas mobilis]AHB10659.1 phenazine biosynthesis protein PhzF family [Zymomonas mobilis subsp. mobilis str. CP4 = NRRL B-14023]AHJ70971.1 putative isomerase yddE [Zymomonas mobilis subsp. mobilis NRRL B-12526]AHJ72824.1 putative isomerase yddE [Zymomonas mobilis subsp. mobilis str. CP4 = NRRL B-14023]TWE26035.1 PhzF family phenazine biosynthesis protein [Zymomonas mobilis]